MIAESSGLTAQVQNAAPAWPCSVKCLCHLAKEQARSGARRVPGTVDGVPDRRGIDLPGPGLIVAFGVVVGNGRE